MKKRRKLLVTTFCSLLLILFTLHQLWAESQKKSSIIISEICFLPKDGEPEWIELKNISSKQVNIAGWQITNGEILNIVLPKGLLNMPPHAHVLIIFDGRGDTEFRSEINDLSFDEDKLVVLHTPSELCGDILGDTAAGECSLYAAGERKANSIRSFVVWGHKPSTKNMVADAVNGRLWRYRSDSLVVDSSPAVIIGGPIAMIKPGGSIGLYGDCRGTRLDDWLVYKPAESTPGEENPLPAPLLYLPSNGTHITRIEGPQNLTFSWGRIRGATSYHFQLCEDLECGTVAIDAPNCEGPYYTAEMLSANVYYWRVSSTTGDLGRKSKWSSTNKLIFGYPKVR